MPELLTDAQKVMRNDTGQRIAVALEALASEVNPSTVIAPEYDETQTYAVGDLVIYRSVLYRCTTAITTPEEWTAAHWTAVTVADELADKYEKPTGGIPKNDLAAGVQESLNKADTALQQHQSLAAYRTAAAQDVIDANLMALGLTGASVGDLVRVAAVDANGKPTSWRKAPLCEIKTNPNLLDNWYFVGGGSQQGGGQFPINQRGQATYPNAGHCIDRWENSGPFYVSQYWINMNANTSITQKLEDALKSSLNGKTITLSLVYAVNVNLISGTVVYQSAPQSAITVASDSSFTISINTSGNIELKSTNTYASCQAIKLELGSEQTLAHWDGTEWVLNEIPDYQQELAKCQRYYETGIGFIGAWPIANSFDTSIPFKVTKAKTPTLENLICNYWTGSGYEIVPNAIAVTNDAAPLFGVRISSYNNGLPANTVYIVSVAASADL